MEEFIKFL